ncbi:MAG: MFS transporter [Spirochaetia bacterium]|nr:MFS transporter [Spirochaetia bacterium]
MVLRIMQPQIQEQEHPRTTIAAILTAVFLLGAGSALQGTAVALRGNIEGFASQMIGIIISSYFIGFIIGSILVVSFIRFVGYVRTFAAFASLASAASLAHLIVIDPIAWILFRSLYGIFIAGMLVIVESWLNSSTSTYNRGRILGLYSLVYLAAMGAGQPLIAVWPPAGFELFAVTSILVSLSLVPLALAQVSGVPQVDRTPFRPIKTFAKSPMAGFGVILSGMSAEAMWGMAPLFGYNSGFSESGIGTLMLSLSVGALASQWPLGWISDRSDRRITILAGAGLSAAAAGGIALVGAAGMPLYVLTFLFGAFCMPLYSLSIALLNDQLTHSEMVHAASALVVFYGIGSAAGPYGASVCMGLFGPQRSVSVYRSRTGRICNLEPLPSYARPLPPPPSPGALSSLSAYHLCRLLPGTPPGRTARGTARRKAGAPQSKQAQEPASEPSPDR